MGEKSKSIANTELRLQYVVTNNPYYKIKNAIFGIETGFMQLICTRVVANLANAFPDGSGVYQQDSTPCHKAKKVMNYMKKMKITVLDWPGNSPDSIQSRICGR